MGEFVKGLPKVTLQVEGEPKFHMLPQQVTKENIYWVFCRSNPYLVASGTAEKILPNAEGKFENLTVGGLYVVHGDVPKVGDTFHSLSMERKRRLWNEAEKIAEEQALAQKHAAAHAAETVLQDYKAREEAEALARVHATREERLRALEARLGKKV